MSIQAPMSRRRSTLSGGKVPSARGPTLSRRLPPLAITSVSTRTMSGLKGQQLNSRKLASASYHTDAVDQFGADVAISGDYAFVADMPAGLLVLDVGTPSTPTLLGSYVTPDHAHGVFASDNYAYVAASGAGLQIVEVFQRSFDLSSNVAQSTVIESPHWAWVRIFQSPVTKMKMAVRATEESM